MEFSELVRKNSKPFQLLNLTCTKCNAKLKSLLKLIVWSRDPFPSTLKMAAAQAVETSVTSGLSLDHPNLDNLPPSRTEKFV